MRERAPDLRGEIQPSFGAGADGHRDAIRTHLNQQLQAQDPRLADLSTPPDLAEWSISITHTFGLGGWVAVRKPRQIGFDLEVRERVREVVVRRMCTAEEVERASDVALLWSAKEALFKAMARGQPATLSQLKIATWTTDGPLVHFTSDGGGRGVAQAQGKFAAAWCLI